MSSRRRVAKGRIRVDAGRAIAKLREYQLPDPLFWCLEVVRAAVAANATSIQIEGDSDDIWVGWDGPVPAEDDLRDVLNELVSPAPAPDRRWLRLLATGINTALGLNPRFVDLFLLPKDAAPSRIRFQADMLRAKAREPHDGSSAPLRGEILRDVPAPAGFAGPGVVVQMRRAAELATVFRFVAQRPVPELALIRSTAAQVALPISVQGNALEPTEDLVRIPLRNNLDGFLAITPALRSSSGPRTQYAELGVVLSDVALALPGAPERWRGQVPIRLFLNAERLPTNASRSEVRAEQAPVREAMQQVPSLLPGLMAALLDKSDNDARAAAIGVLAGFPAAALWSGRVSDLPEWARPLAEAPLLRNAGGQPHSLAQLQQEAVHLGREPLEPEIAHHFPATLWAPPGSPELQLIDGRNVADVKGQLHQVRKRIRAEQQWLKREPRKATLSPSKTYCSSYRFEPDTKLELPAGVPSTVKKLGMSGQVNLLNPRAVKFHRRRYGQVTLLKQGRPLCHEQVPSPFPFEAVIEAPTLRAQADFMSAEHDDARAAALGAAEAAMVNALHALAAAANQNEAMQREFAEDFRKCQEHLAKSVQSISASGRVRAAAIERELRGPLLSVPCWPTRTPNGVSFTSLEALRDAATPRRKHKGKGSERAPLLFVSPKAKQSKHRGLVELPLNSEDQRRIKALMPHAQFVRYQEPRFHEPTSAERLALMVSTPGSITLAIEDDDSRRGAIAWGTTRSEIRWQHCGSPVEHQPYEPTFLPCIVVVDDDRLVPDEAWSTVVFRPRALHPSTWEVRWIAAVITAMQGKPDPNLHYEGNLAENSKLHAQLIDIAARKANAARMGRETYDALFELPLVARIGRPRATLNQLKEESPPLQWLPPGSTPTFDIGDWSPLLLDEARVEPLARILRRKIGNGSAELERLHTRYLRDRNLELHRQQPEVALTAPDDAVSIDRKRFSGFARLSHGPLRIEVLYERRRLTEIQDSGPPIRAAIEIVEGANLIRPDASGLTSNAVGMIKNAVASYASEILTLLAQTQPARIVDDPAARTLLTDWVTAHQSSKRRDAAREILLDAPIFPTVQGGRCSIRNASSARQIRTADWRGKWLGPSDAEPADAPILQLSADQTALREVLELLANKSVVNRTRAVMALQGQRRVERGLVATPRLVGIADAMRHSLLDLVKDRRRANLLGPGEIGVANRAGPSVLRLYSGGAEVTEVQLDWSLRFEIAMESPRLASHFSGQFPEHVLQRLRAQLKPVLRAFFKRCVAPNHDDLDLGLRHGLRRALLLNDWLTPRMAQDLPLFETTAGRWHKLPVLRKHVENHGSLWVAISNAYVKRTLEPLDPSRFALRMPEDELDGLMKIVPAIAADDELADDAKARRNLAQPKAQDLDLPREIGHADLIDQLPIGTKGVRGTVGLLNRRSRKRAGLYLHKGMQPLGKVDVPDGDWPVVARLEVPRLTPNRTWSGPVDDDVLHDAMRQVRRHVEKRLRKLTPEPPDALVQKKLDRAVSNRLFKQGHVRGRIWLTSSTAAGLIRGSVNLRVYTQNGKHTLPLHGVVHVVHEEARRTDVFLLRLLTTMYRGLIQKLATEALRNPKPERADALLAHLIHAAYIGEFDPAPLTDLRVPFFHPLPVALPAAIALLQETTPVLVGNSGTPSQSPCVMDDGSHAASLFIQHLGDRIKSVTDEPPPRRSLARRRARSAAARSARTRTEHPLTPVANELYSLLKTVGIDGDDLQSVIVVPNRRRSLMLYNPQRQQLELSAQHRAWIAMLAARQSDSPDLERGLRILAAHAVGVLNRALVSINDASEQSAIDGLLRSR